MATNEEIAKWLNDKTAHTLAFDLPVFTQPAPVKMTCKQRDGSYTRHPLIGGEKMRFKNAYVGKRDGVILCFEPIGWGQAENDDKNDMVLAEIPLKKMPASFDLFGFTVAELMAGENLPSANVAPLATMGEKSGMTDRYKDNPNWGTW